MSFADATEALKNALPGYEVRPQQRALAEAIERSLEDKTHLLAEASTGTGKSLGYLIPAIESGKRVVVSTATKALQDQLHGKDLPLLAEHLGKPFAYALLKGRTNYLCQARLRDPEMVADEPMTKDMAAAVEAHADDPEFFGEREDLPSVEDSVWRKFVTTSDECPGKRQCPFGDVCFSEKARERARLADVVVVNHALFLTELRVQDATDGYGSLIGKFDAVVVDEAHELEEYAGNIFGSQFTEGSVRRLCSEMQNWVRRTLIDDEMNEQIRSLVGQVMMTMAGLWQHLEVGTIRQATLMEVADYYVEFINAVIDLDEWWQDETIPGRIAKAMYDGSIIKYRALGSRISSMRERFTQIMLGSFDEYVRWVEEERIGRGRSAEVRRVLKSAPVTVAPILRRLLFDTDATAILTSATLSVDGKFDYISERLGVDVFRSIDVGTPFDYTQQARLYVPSHLPDPGRERAQWQSMAIAEMGSLVRASGGRAMLLFTSWSAMNEAYSLLAPRLPFTCLKQGDAPNKVLAERFKEDVTSVLFATRSFMTGVDIQGEACSLVVVDKLTFPVPTDPIVEARTNLIERAGGNSFSDYTIPVMTLTLKQAFGRLIRHRNDTGVVAILDPRLRTKGYGSKVLRSLPPAPLLTNLSQVEEFFAAQGVEPAAAPVATRAL